MTRLPGDGHRASKLYFVSSDISQGGNDRDSPTKNDSGPWGKNLVLTQDLHSCFSPLNHEDEIGDRQPV